MIQLTKYIIIVPINLGPKTESYYKMTQLKGYLTNTELTSANFTVNSKSKEYSTGPELKSVNIQQQVLEISLRLRKLSIEQTQLTAVTERERQSNMKVGSN